MALGTSEITTTLVATTIGEATNDVGALCRSSKVNRWSKRKPIKKSKKVGLIDTDYDPSGTGYGGNGSYGITIPSLASTIDSTYASANWAYDKPTGLSSSPYRLGDFRRYEHAAPTPLLQDWGNSTMTFGRFITNPDNIRFEVTPPSALIVSDCLTIQNLFPINSDSVLFDNYYLGVDVYAKAATSGYPLLSMYSKKTISYSTLRTDLTGETVLDNDRFYIIISKLSTLAAGEYKLRFYLSSAATIDGTRAWGGIDVNIVPINWTTANPNVINLKVSSLATECITKFLSILPSGGQWADSTTDPITSGIIPMSKVGSLRNYKVKIEIKNISTQTITINKSRLRIKYNFLSDWDTLDSAYNSFDTGSLTLTAGSTAILTSGSLPLLPSFAPIGDVETSINPDPLLFYATIGEFGSIYEQFPHSTQGTVILEFNNL